MIVKFQDVGRNKISWEAECTAKDISELEYDWFYNQVKKRAFVMSCELDFILNEKDNTTGTIYAGFHTIGKFVISN